MIKHLTVSNFKSLKNFELDLGPVNVLVGPNMAGKSNVIDVFKFVFDLLHPSAGQDGLWYALNNRGAAADLPWKGSETDSVRLVLEGDLINAPGTHWKYELSLSFPPTGFVQIQKEALRLRRGDEERDLIEQKGTPGPWLKNFDGKELGGFPGNSRSVLQDRTTSWDGDFMRVLIGSWRFHQFIPTLMKLPNQTGVGGVLDRVGGNISAWLMWIQTYHPEQFSKIAQAARDLLPGLKSLVTFPTPQGSVFISSQESGLTGPINLWQMSDGELALLGLLSVIYSPPEWAGSLYCIEEPESHLYPKVLTSLIKLMRQVREEAVQAGLPLSQVIIATQSPQVVDLFSLDEVIWLHRKEGATIVTRPRDRQHLRDLVSDKELGLADIVYSGILSEPE